MTTKLRSAQDGRAPKAAASALAAALSGAEHFEDVEVPLPGGTIVHGRMTVIGAARALDVEGDVVSAMSARALEQTVITQGEYELERAIRTLAEVVRDPDDKEQPLGSVADWGRLPQETISAMWLRYGDLRERIDPVSRPLTQAERDEIANAISKKNATHLRSFGVRTLSAYLLASADRPASSATPLSSDGPSSSAS